MTISLGLPDLQYKIATFLELLDALEVLSIPMNRDALAEDARRDALAFTIESIHHMYSDSNWRVLLQDLLDKIKNFKNATEASWYLKGEVDILFKAIMLEMMATTNDTHRQQLEAVANLFFSTKKQALQQHQRHEAVHFGGIPRDLLPNWYLNHSWKGNPHSPPAFL